MTKLVLQLIILSTAFSISRVALADDAATLLTDMARKISATNKFSVTLLVRYDAMQETGQLIEFSERREMILNRPNDLRVNTRQSDGTEEGLVINSETITQFNLNEAVYSEVDRSINVDKSVRYAVAKLGIRFPLARLLVSNFPEELEKKVTRVDFVESNTLGNASITHLAAVGTEVDSQYWIREDGLPVRIVLIYKNAPGQPRFSADFVDWNLAPEIGPDTFQYAVPAGTERIPVLIRNEMPSREIAE